MIAVKLVVASLLAVSGSIPFESVPQKEKSSLVKVRLSGGKTIVGELKSDKDNRLEIFDLKVWNDVTIAQSEVMKLTKDISDAEAISTAGLPAILAWKIKQTIGTTPARIGKIAKISPTVVYVTLNSKDRIEKGQKLSIYREQGNIIDPDSGEVIGKERARIGYLEVIEVTAELSKTKLIGDLEVLLKEGDQVSVVSADRPVAIFPLVNEAGVETIQGKRLAERLTTVLVSSDINIVERNFLDKILIEQSLQASALFDADTARKAGKFAGAYAVLSGRVVSRGRITEAHVRLIKVETGEILLAGSQEIGGADSGSGAASAGDGFLCDLSLVQLNVINSIGFRNEVKVRGTRSPHGLFMHPPAPRTPATATFFLEKSYSMFVGSVALNDSIPESSRTPVTFRIVGDGKILWTSRPIQNKGDSQEFNVSIAGVNHLELRVDCPGDHVLAHAVWIEPRVLSR